MIDTEPRPRIFVSSIMTGYGDIRAAASRAIDDAGCEPVLAANFPAGTVSPRTACLDGVASCDGIAAFAKRPDRVEVIVWAQVAWTTPRDEEVVDPTSFMETRSQREVQRLAHEADTPLFDYGQAKDTRVEASRLRLTQGDPGDWRGGRDLVVVDLYENGTLSVSINVTGLTGGDAMRDIGQLYRIDPNDVSRRLLQAWGFAARWWEHHDLNPAFSTTSSGTTGISSTGELLRLGRTAPPAGACSWESCGVCSDSTFLTTGEPRASTTRLCCDRGA